MLWVIKIFRSEWTQIRQHIFLQTKHESMDKINEPLLYLQNYMRQKHKDINPKIKDKFLSKPIHERTII